MKQKAFLTIVAAGLLCASAGFAANSLLVNGNNNNGDTIGADLEGAKGLAVICDGSTNNVYVESQEPNNETHYRAEFLIRPGAVKLNAGNALRIGRFVTNPGGDSVQILLRRTNVNNWALKVKYRDETSAPGFKPLANLSLVVDGNHYTTKKVRVEWQADSAPGAGDGFVKVARCGNATSNCDSPEQERVNTTADNETYRLDSARFGILYGSGNKCAGSGAWHFDGFASYR